VADKEPKPFDQMPGEGHKAFAAFKAFLSLGDKRSVRATARKLSKNSTTIKQWSARWQWQERLRAWIAHNQQVERAALDDAARKEAAEWAVREGEVRKRRWKIGNDLLAKAEAMLQFPVAQTRSADGKTIVEPADWTLAQAARLAEAGDKLVALATGQSTDNTQLTGKDGQPVVPAGSGTVVIYLPEKEKLPSDGK
jgi:hypothetical protein